MSDKRVVMDFDDLCDGNDPFDTLLLLKERDHNFKVTLFAIPTRCSDKLLATYDSVRDWVQLAVHGWTHARHECLSWTSEETEDKLKLALGIYPGFVHIFKAPNWSICDEVYKGLRATNFAVADHLSNLEIMPDQPNYVYLERLRDDPFIRMHGHIQDWAGTGLTEKANGKLVNDRYLLPVGTTYAFVSEAVSERKRVGQVAPDEDLEV